MTPHLREPLCEGQRDESDDLRITSHLVWILFRYSICPFISGTLCFELTDTVTILCFSSFKDFLHHSEPKNKPKLLRRDVVFGWSPSRYGNYCWKCFHSWQDESGDLKVMLHFERYERTIWSDVLKKLPRSTIVQPTQVSTMLSEVIERRIKMRLWIISL